MVYFWFDANAFAKRYVVEKGSPLINYCFAQVAASRMFCLFDSLNEVYAVMARKHRKQDGTLRQPDYDQAIQKFEAEVINNADVLKVRATVNQIITSRNLIAPHAINSTDALILQCALDKASELRARGNDLVLMCSDKRLLRAANSERLPTFNPENDGQKTLDGFIK